MAWTFADIWESIAAAQPDHPAFIHGDRLISWGEFDARADALAAALHRQPAWPAGPRWRRTSTTAPSISRPTSPRSRPGSRRFNTNYRYGPEELTYLFDNADAEAIVFHASFSRASSSRSGRAAQGEGLDRRRRARPPGPRLGGDYDAIVAKRGDAARESPWGRSGDDLLLLYTGGTTGMPKGVMWRQDDLFKVLGAGGNAAARPAAAERSRKPELIARHAAPADIKPIR
jgi:acyl-CoA synthetase (AMP-forming)/AMP-acid ligase II